MAKGGISGLAVGVAAVGGFLVYAGIKDVPLVEGMREMMAGRVPTGRDPKKTAVFITPGSAVGDAGASLIGGLTNARTYNLPGVQPHVKDAASEIGTLNQIGTIGGFRAGDLDHGRGLALDLMINNTAHGDRTAAYVYSHRERLGVTYIIWNMRIASPTQNWAWRTYKPITNQGDFRHEKHVHVSFKAIWKYTPPLGQSNVQPELNR